MHKNIDVLSDGVIFEKDKAKYAVRADGTPNILIDDWGTNVRKWADVGGKAIKYQADENNLDELKEKLIAALS